MTRNDLEEYGATYEKAEDRSGDTKTGWWLDGVYLGETVLGATEAIEDLERMNSEDVLEMEVYAVSDYGDHCHTQQLVTIGEPKVVQPVRAAHSETGLAMPSDTDDWYDIPNKPGAVVTLSVT